MKTTVLSFLILFSLYSCNSDDEKSIEYPVCVQSLIDDYVNSNQPTSPRASVEKYTYNNETVYVCHFQNFPDGQSIVINSNCDGQCVLGGIDGVENDCLNWENAEFIETIWTDNR